TSLAIVGLNGAGKTTMIKLLSRLNDPQAGRITADGRDILTLDVTSWRRQLAVTFQEFVRYPVPASDNVSFGALWRDGAEDAVALAADKVGIRGAVEALPNGWDTVLTRRFADGGELSGG